MSEVLPHLEITPPRPHWLAGAGGFEPRHRCGHAGQRKGVAHMLTQKFASLLRWYNEGSRSDGKLSAGTTSLCPRCDGSSGNNGVETALAGWGARIRTWEWRNQNPPVPPLISTIILKNPRISTRFQAIG